MEEEIRISHNDRIYFLGDYIDRGPRVADVLEYLIGLQREGFNIHPLMGNHEDMMLKAMNDKRYRLVWFSNGAAATMRSFSVPGASMKDEADLSGVPQRYLHFLSDLDLYYALEDYIIVHAGLNFRHKNVFEDREALLWSREMQYDGERIGHRTVVHGHTPMPLKKIMAGAENKSNGLINLDAGCVYRELPGYGNLVAMDLDSRELYVQENIE